MAGFGYACAVVLAAVFVRAATAKVARHQATAAGFAALGVPGPRVVARAVPVAELALAVTLLAAPRPGGIAALAVLAAFTAFLARALRAGVEGGCNCFGQARAEPVSGLHVVRNGLLGLLAAGATVAPGPAAPGAGAVVTALALVSAGGIGLAAARARRRRR